MRACRGVANRRRPVGRLALSALMSVALAKIAHMFEKQSSPEVIARFDELFERCYPSTTAQSAVLVDRICGASRAENRAAAAQLVAIGELFGYRLSRCSETVPSRALADFVRCRDLTCRWPGCDQPAIHGDVDHMIPSPKAGSPTPQTSSATAVPT